MYKRILSIVLISTLFLTACGTSTTKTSTETTRAFTNISVSYEEVEKSLCSAIPSGWQNHKITALYYGDDMVPYSFPYSDEVDCLEDSFDSFFNGAYPWHSYKLNKSEVKFVIFEFKSNSEIYKSLTEGNDFSYSASDVDHYHIFVSAINGQYVLLLQEIEWETENSGTVIAQSAPYKTEAGKAIYDAFMALK